MKEKSKRERLMLSIPAPLKSWIHEQAEENCTSANAEVIRCIRETRAHAETQQRAGQVG
jgi:hypothetical protein